MFEEVPSADLYMLKLILHDWADEDVLHILASVRKSAPAGGRIFVIEHVVPGPETPHFAKLYDIHMMCWGPGRERTAAEYAALLEEAGWSLRRHAARRQRPAGPRRRDHAYSLKFPRHRNRTVATRRNRFRLTVISWWFDDGLVWNYRERRWGLSEVSPVANFQKRGNIRCNWRGKR
ncbi:MAG: hypothetical protein HYX73_02615 [Acidobacteria bacterium]|nr:hypothetical protein [Acidobacteriota bacterium]